MQSDSPEHFHMPLKECQLNFEVSSWLHKLLSNPREILVWVPWTSTVCTSKNLLSRY